MQFLQLVALLASISAVGAFHSSPFPQGMTRTLRSPHSDLSALTVPFLSSKQEESEVDYILKSLTKQEAKLQKRREEALSQLSKYDKTLDELKNQKDHYMAAAQMETPPVGGSFTETALRSAVKAFMWRIVAGSVTFITTLKFSGSVKMALEVVGADFVSKAFTMFIGERLMNKSQKGRKGGSDAASRSLAKALIWRLFAICNTLTIAIFVTKDLSGASKIASTDAVFKTALMFFYERAWANVRWGKEYNIEFSI